MNSIKTQSRTGKIARLPHAIREKLNQRLLDNQSGSKICQWLNSLPETKAVCKGFARQTGAKPLPINASCLSHWRRGGFQDWLRNQQTLEQTRQLAHLSIKLGEADDTRNISEGAAVLLSAQILQLIQSLGAADWTAQIRSQLRTAAVPGRSNVTNPAAQSSSTAGAGSPSPLPGGAEGRNLSRRFVASKRSEEGSAAEADAEALVAQGNSAPDQQPLFALLDHATDRLGKLVKLVSKLRSGDHSHIRLVQRENMFSLQLEKYENTRAAAAPAEEPAKPAEPEKVDYAPRLEIMGKQMFGELWHGLPGYNDHLYAHKGHYEYDEDGEPHWRPKKKHEPGNDSAATQPAEPSSNPTPQADSSHPSDSAAHQLAQSSSTASAGSPSTPDPRPSAPKCDPMSPNVTSCDQKPSPAPTTPPANSGTNVPQVPRSAEHPLGTNPASATDVPSRSPALGGMTNLPTQSSSAAASSQPTPSNQPPANTSDPENDPDASEEPEEDAPAEDPWLAHLYHIARKQAEPGFLSGNTQPPAIPPSPLNVSAEPNNKLPSS